MWAHFTFIPDLLGLPPYFLFLSSQWQRPELPRPRPWTLTLQLAGGNWYESWIIQRQNWGCFYSVIYILLLAFKTFSSLFYHTKYIFTLCINIGDILGCSVAIQIFFRCAKSFNPSTALKQTSKRQRLAAFIIVFPSLWSVNAPI